MAINVNEVCTALSNLKARQVDDRTVEASQRRRKRKRHHLAEALKEGGHYEEYQRLTALPKK